MIQHYLKIAFRNTLKYKTQSIIGILGMAMGLAAFTLGWQWYKYENSFDSFYPRSDRLYIVSGIEKQTGKREQRLSQALLDVFKTDFPEVESATALYGRFSSGYKCGEKKLGNPNIEFVDEHFFDFFTPRVICGKEKISLAGDEVVISRTFAQKFWDSAEDALGSELVSGYNNKFIITSVIEDYPENSVFRSINMWEPDIMTRRRKDRIDPDLKWKQSEITIFICLNEAVNAKDFNQKIKHFLIDKKYNEELELEIIHVPAIQRIFGEYFKISRVFSLDYVYLFMITTCILLLCVLVNYTNLYITNMHGRTREMMLRHAVGAGKKEMIFQSFTEVFLQFVLIVIIACCLIELFTPMLSRKFDMNINRGILWNDFLKIMLAGFALVLLIQIPLFIYFVRNSAMKTSAVGTRARHSSITRKSLLVFQVGICASFMYCALGTGKQLTYLSQKELGFDKEGLLFFIMNNSDRKSTVEEIEKSAAVESLSSGGIFMYSSEPYTTNIVEWAGKAEGYKPNFQFIECDNNFFDTFRLKLIEGKNFDETEESGKKKGLINEEAARIIGRDSIIGRIINVFNNTIYGDGRYGTDELEIIGVFRNFQSTSFMNATLPLIIIPGSGHYYGYTYYARAGSGNKETARKQIINAYKRIAEPFDPEPEVFTMDEVFDQLHKSENASFQMFVVLALLSVLISLFGIYSVSRNSIHRRRKEIAVHKIMGGSTQNIVAMLLKEYIWISLLSGLFFIPFAWYFVNRWLEQFPYRANAGIMEILVVILLTTLFITFTVLGHILRASTENPAEVVKSE